MIILIISIYSILSVNVFIFNFVWVDLVNVFIMVVMRFIENYV